MKQKNVGAEIMQSFGITEICRKSKISIRPDGRMEIIFDTIVYNAFGGHTPEWMRYKRFIERMFKVEIPLAID